MKTSGSGKRSKIKALPPPGDFIALGKQNKYGTELDTRSSTSHSKKHGSSSISSSSSDRKRESSSPISSSSLTSKKPKLIAQTFTPLGRPAEAERKGSPAVFVPQFEESAIDVDPSDFLEQVLEALDIDDEDRVEGLICGAVKSLRANRSKPDPALYLSFMYLSKTQPSLFVSDTVIEAFCSLLKRDISLNFKAKGNPLVSVFACNVLMTAYSEEDNWPDEFVKVYVEDSLGERIWVDRDDCRAFVENIQTAFNTKLPNKNRLIALFDLVSRSGEQSGSSSPSLSMFDDDDKSQDGEEKVNTVIGDIENCAVSPRYTYQQEVIENEVVEIIKDQLNKRQPMDGSTRNLIRLIMATCGSGEIRLIAAQRLEMWLQNPKLARSAQDLLMSVCMNCNQSAANDLETIAQLIKIRMKTKPLINHYMACIRELLTQHHDNHRIILTHTIYNELSNARNPNNMALLVTIFQNSSEASARILADIFQDLLSNKDDYLRALRALLREIVRALRHDMNIVAFCLGLMQERTETKFTEMDQSFKDRFVMAITDLITLSIFLGVTPSVREAAGACARGERKDLESLHQYQHQVSLIQRDSIWWLHTVVPKILEMKANDYVHCIHKVLFMENAEHYHNKDNWPPEGDRIHMLRLASEIPVLEDTLMRILVIGLSRDLPLSSADAVELADQLIKRAAKLHMDGFDVLRVERLELIDALMNLCAYRHPENIALPKGYQPPTLAISNLYWKAWMMLLIIAAFNPSTFGLSAWENYPTLKCLMEMVMTNNYKFPPPTTATEEKVIDEIRMKECQLAQKEKHDILEFESHLAAATSKVTITESNSLLVAQLTSMDPNGIARKPPSQALDQLKLLNQSLRIGQMLCRSRNPDFLLDIIQRQGTRQSMPWLAELVESNEGSLDVLPVQCLCEFLLHEPQDGKDFEEEEDVKGDKYKKKQKMKKQEQLLAKLQLLVHSPASDSRTTFEVLDYFFKRLSSNQTASRMLAIKGLSLVVSKSHMSPEDAEETDLSPEDEHLLEMLPAHKWLLIYLPRLPLFEAVKPQACLAIRQACRVETDPNLVSAYIIFLSKHVKDQNLHELDDLSLDIAQLIVERTTVMNHILPQVYSRSDLANHTLRALVTLYTNYLRKAKEPDKEAYDWSNTQDQIILQWESGDSATMHVLVVHSMIILLTYGLPEGNDQYDELLETWFPLEGSPPSAFLLDTSEEALLLPDWLKLRMIRSSIDRLVDAALQDLEPSQLFLFVQSFGIPIRSMSKLLRCLDSAVDMNYLTVEQAGVDKTYLAQLIQIQKLRGAEGGDKFYQLLTDGSTPAPQEEESVEMAPASVQPIWSHLQKELCPTLTTDQKELTALYLQIFTPEPAADFQVEQQHCQKLIKELSTNKEFAINSLKAFGNILSSPQAAEFTDNLFHMSQKACSVIRLITSKVGHSPEELSQVMEQLAAKAAGQRSPLAAIVNQYMASNKKMSQKGMLKQNIHTMAKSLRSSSKIDEEKAVSELIKLSEGRDPRLETLIHLCMNEPMKINKTDKLARVTSRVLLDEQTRTKLTSSAACLFIDWLELLDPEVIHTAPDLQLLLLFAKKNTDAFEHGHYRNQAYLLALLTHQSNWETLHHCIDKLLDKQNQADHDPTSVLDFLWACIHIPKIWQGQERKGHKNQITEDVLGLSLDPLYTLVDYIIKEAAIISTKNDSGDQKVTSEVTACIGSRIDLLKCCLGTTDDTLKSLINYLQRKLTQNESYTCLYHHLLLELYLQYPYLLGWLKDPNLLLTDTQTTQKSISQLDLISHRILNSLGNAVHGEVSRNRMYDANISCRKLASEHPLLILRQLPMIAALLQGKTQFTLGEMKHRNYLLFFTHVLGLLELLQPHIFRKENLALENVLEAYFCLIKAHGHDQKQLSSIIVKFIKFLQQFVIHEPQRAVHVLQKYVDLLSGVSSHYPDLSVLKSLLAGLSLPRQIMVNAVTEQDTTPVLVPVRPTSPWTISQLAPFFSKISKNSPREDVLDVLHDLDEASKRKVDILEHFQEDLKRLMSDLNDECRNFSYNMMMRFIRQNPNSAAEFVPVFLQCLGSKSPDVVNSSLRNLAEFVALCQEHGSVILEKAFLVGIDSTIETSTYISEALQLMNMETAH